MPHVQVTRSSCARPCQTCRVY
ncbi:hypothetical protein F383_15175 [Gossypium arboreum]|uniref:Uncharacterized protein n=1 Tax=Gossypium arboreum TaxID=29729 RepID=A0A0B0NCK9_GOSAR|nr:hypothetical protein F383_15175 [Gossypium arboreum]